jgi:hypothetical protein
MVPVEEKSPQIFTQVASKKKNPQIPPPYPSILHPHKV